MYASSQGTSGIMELLGRLNNRLLVTSLVTLALPRLLRYTMFAFELLSGECVIVLNCRWMELYPRKQHVRLQLIVFVILTSEENFEPLNMGELFDLNSGLILGGK